MEWDEYKKQNQDEIRKVISLKGYAQLKTARIKKAELEKMSPCDRLDLKKKKDEERNAAVVLECLQKSPSLLITERGQAILKHCKRILKNTDYLLPYSEEFISLEGKWQLEDMAKKLALSDQTNDEGPGAA